MLFYIIYYKLSITIYYYIYYAITGNTRGLHNKVKV